MTARDPALYVSSLLDLHMSSGTEQRQLFRQAMAALARAASEGGPSPLEGFRPQSLVLSAKVLISSGLIDDLDWLAPEAAGVALFTLASALPSGIEQRELGRRVLSRLLSGNAHAFAAMATLMVGQSAKMLGTPGAQARLGLVMETPLSFGVNDTALAFALVSKRELAREWVIVPSTKSLPSRRRAARILERAALLAAKRARDGDTFAIRVLGQEDLQAALSRLVNDRESLVWRHAAVARGLLALYHQGAREQLEVGLHADASITLLRRAIASATAMVAIRPDDGERLLSVALRRGLFTRDPGATSAMAWALARPIELEPAATEQILAAVPQFWEAEDVGEALSELKMEVGDLSAMKRIADGFCARRGWPSSIPTDEHGRNVVLRDVYRDLAGEDAEDGTPLRRQITNAIGLFATDSAQSAFALTRILITACSKRVALLEGSAEEDERSRDAAGTKLRRANFSRLRDVDMSLLERHVLYDLCRLGPEPASRAALENDVDALRERMAGWVVAREVDLPEGDFSDDESQTLLRVRRLRALLHVVDGEAGEESDDPSRVENFRARWLKVARSLLDRFSSDPPQSLRRTMLATLARTLDAMNRTGASDPADALVLLAQKLTKASDYQALSEASMDVDFTHLLAAYAQFLTDSEPKIELFSEEDAMPGAQVNPIEKKLLALSDFTRQFPPESTLRIDALRTALLKLSASLDVVVRSDSLHALATTGDVVPDALVNIENAVFAFRQLQSGARARYDIDGIMPSIATLRTVSVDVSRVLGGAEESLASATLRPSIRDLTYDLPAPLARAVSSVMWRLVDLPIARESAAHEVPRSMANNLPTWVPTRRTLGGFFVHRVLGTGGAGSVFVVTRVEEKDDPVAERFALKVPEYTVTAAANLSESEFLAMFRSEASALMSLVPHKSLARFVSIDVAAKPKPILVMELIEGSNLEQLLSARSLDGARLWRTLVDVVDGLEAMHSLGVGHLDVKPSNVIVRRDGGHSVLVDFGLAGRRVRKGCGTGPYVAPEVWGAVQDEPLPMPADIYALGCVIYESLTCQVLFQAPSELVQVSIHLAHDGRPTKVAALATPENQPIADLLSAMLRRNAGDRLKIGDVKQRLVALRPWFEALDWPLGDAQGGAEGRGARDVA